MRCGISKNASTRRSCKGDFCPVDTFPENGQFPPGNIVYVGDFTWEKTNHRERVAPEDVAIDDEKTLERKVLKPMGQVELVERVSQGLIIRVEISRPRDEDLLLEDGKCLVVLQFVIVHLTIST